MLTRQIGGYNPERKGRMRQGGLHFIAVFAVLVTLPLLACKPSEQIVSPFDSILPQQVDVAPNLWFEHTGTKGTFYTEKSIVEQYQRAFKGSEVKFWSQILVFSNADSAHRFIERQSSSDIYINKQSDELPSSVVQSVPDESVSWIIETEPTFIKEDEY